MEHEQLPTPESDEPQPPHIWLGSLECYEQGILHGKWIRADQQPTDLVEELVEIFSTAPIETSDYFIWDSDGFYGVPIAQNESLDKVVRLANMTANYGVSYAYWAHHCKLDLDQAERTYERAYLGEFEHQSDVVTYIAERKGMIEAVERARESLSPPFRYFVGANLNALRVWLKREKHVVIMYFKGKIHAYYTGP